ncbi:OmpH family outer membrane protein [Chitinophagaceae bacterium MMS25-I14]
MKNASLVLSTLALIGVLILFGFHFKGNKDMGKHAPVAGNTSTSAATSGHIAYVNIDTLEEHYEYLKNKKDEFNKRQASIEAELQNSAQKMQSDYAALQQKYQAGTLTQAEGEAAQKRLAQMKQSLDTRQQSVTEQLLKERDAFNSEIQKKLDSFLTEYNKDKGYDYILSYSKGNVIMYADKRLDITQDVIKGMNELSKSDKGDTPGKK